MLGCGAPAAAPDAVARPRSAKIPKGPVVLEGLPEALARPMTPNTPLMNKKLPPLDTAKKKQKEAAEVTLAAAVTSNDLGVIEAALESATAAGLAGDHPAVMITELVKSEIEHHTRMRERAARLLEAGVSFSGMSRRV